MAKGAGLRQSLQTGCPQLYVPQILRLWATGKPSHIDLRAFLSPFLKTSDPSGAAITYPSTQSTTLKKTLQITAHG